jgi:hypothetical protein
LALSVERHAVAAQGKILGVPLQEVVKSLADNIVGGMSVIWYMSFLNN